METKNIAIWVLTFALIGALGEVPGFFLNQVLASMFIFAGVAFVICCIVSYKKNKKVQHPKSF